MAATVEYNEFDFSDTDWESLGDVSTWPINYVPEIPEDPNRTPIAVRVLEQNEIEISPSSATLNYGVLDGYDIHNMDAVQAIKSSLLEEIRDERLIEVYSDVAGYAEFVEIGSETFSATPRYKVPNRRIVNRIRQVSVTGFNPPATVYVRGPFDLLTGEDGQIEIVNDIANINLRDTCYEELFDRYATIMYRTPILRSDWGDTLDSLYDVQAFEQIIGWIHKIIIDDSQIASSAEVIFSDITPYPYEVEEFREDIEYIRYNIDPTLSEEEVRCYISPDIDFNENGFIVDIPYSTYVDENTGQELSDLLSVNRVFLMGWEVEYTYTITSFGQLSTFAAVCKYRREPIVLSEGSDYAWGFDDDSNLKVVFGIGQTPADEFLEDTYSADITTPTFIIGGPYWDNANGEGPNVDDYRLYPHIGASHTGGAGDGFGKTYLFDELWVVVNRRKSSITIYDPHGEADAALRNSEYELYAMIKCDPPAPIAGYGQDVENDPYFEPFNGTVNHLDCVFDHDPMTVQDLTTCDMALLQEAMAGQSIGITTPFIDDDIQINIYGDESSVEYADATNSVLYRMAQFIYDLSNEDIDEYTYIFGPTELTDNQPRLGMEFRDGIINSISYSYQDASSYLITVTKGPRYLKDTVGMNDASIWQMTVETVTKEGVITQSAGNGIHYAVHVEGMGDFIAVNTVASDFPPEVGDRVTIEINNIPVGWQ